jgi:hypothetical protein
MTIAANQQIIIDTYDTASNANLSTVTDGKSLSYTKAICGQQSAITGSSSTGRAIIGHALARRAAATRSE